MKFVMPCIKAIATIAVLGSLVLADAHPAFATDRWIHNRTENCVWFTIDVGSILGPFHNDQAAFIKPGMTQHFNASSSARLKVRAEPRKTADCSSAKIDDLHIIELMDIPGRDLGPSETSLRGGPGKGSFRIAWGP